MAQFKPIFDWCIKREGMVLENVEHDAGGLTFWGIARNSDPDFNGWPIIDECIKKTSDLKGAQKLCNENELLIQMVYNFYLSAFNKQNMGELNYQELALQVFYHYWNMGGIALKAFQAIVGAKSDGIIGPNTIMRANSTVDQSGLVDRYLGWCLAHYEDIVARHPEDEKFLKGWKNTCVRSDAVKS